MSVLLGVALVCALAALGWRVHRERGLLRSLEASITARSLHLSETLEEKTPRGPWQDVVNGVNGLIEEHRALAAARDGHLVQLRSILDALAEAVVITDSSALVLLANEAAGRVLADDGGVTGRKLTRLLQAGSVVGVLETLRRTGTADPIELELTRGGASRRLSVSARLLPRDSRSVSGPWALFVIRDVSRERELEGLQKELIGNVSHELRTPISVIRGYAETLVEDHERMAAADRSRFVQAIHRHAQRLGSLVEDLLTLSRLDSKYPAFEYEIADLQAEIRTLAEDFLARARATQHTLELDLRDDGARVRADVFRISQVLENLVENAMKYSGPGSTVRILSRRDDGSLVIGVEDNGPGIPAKDVPRIFERFYRVEKGRSRDKGGTGLGLTIVREIVELHGGRVWVESTEGKGSCFWFSLPLVTQAQAAPVP